MLLMGFVSYRWWHDAASCVKIENMPVLLATHLFAGTLFFLFLPLLLFFFSPCALLSILLYSNQTS
jgi:hypothetical protein